MRIILQFHFFRFFLVLLCLPVLGLSTITKHGNIKFIIEGALQIPSAEGFSRVFEDSVNFSINNNSIQKISKQKFIQQLDSFFTQNPPSKIELQSDLYFDLSKRNLKWLYYSTQQKTFKVNVDAAIDEHDDHYHAILVTFEQINW